MARRKRSNEEMEIPSSTQALLEQAEELTYAGRIQLAAAIGRAHNQGRQLAPLIENLLESPSEKPPRGIQNAEGTTQVLFGPEVGWAADNHMQRHLAVVAAAASGRFVQSLVDTCQSPSQQLKPLSCKEVVRQLKDDSALLDLVISSPSGVRKLFLQNCVKERRMGLLEFYIEDLLQGTKSGQVQKTDQSNIDLGKMGSEVNVTDKGRTGKVAGVVKGDDVADMDESSDAADVDADGEVSGEDKCKAAAELLHGCSHPFVVRHLARLRASSSKHLKWEKLSKFHGVAILALMRSELANAVATGGAQASTKEETIPGCDWLISVNEHVKKVWDSWKSGPIWPVLLRSQDSKARTSTLLALVKEFCAQRSVSLPPGGSAKRGQPLAQPRPRGKVASGEGDLVWVPSPPKFFAENFQTLVKWNPEATMELFKSRAVCAGKGIFSIDLPPSFLPSYLDDSNIQPAEILSLAEVLCSCPTPETFYEVGSLRHCNVTSHTSFVKFLFGAAPLPRTKAKFWTEPRKERSKYSCQIAICCLRMVDRLKPTKDVLDNLAMRRKWNVEEILDGAWQMIEDWWSLAGEILDAVLELPEISGRFLESPCRWGGPGPPWAEIETIWGWIFDLGADLALRNGKFGIRAANILEERFMDREEFQAAKKATELNSLLSRKYVTGILGSARMPALWQWVREKGTSADVAVFSGAVTLKTRSEEYLLGKNDLKKKLSEGDYKAWETDVMLTRAMVSDLFVLWWNQIAMPCVTTKKIIRSDEMSTCCDFFKYAPGTAQSELEKLSADQINNLVQVWNDHDYRTLATLLEPLPSRSRYTLVARILATPELPAVLEEPLQKLLDVSVPQVRNDMESVCSQPSVAGREKGIEIMVAASLGSEDPNEVLKTIKWVADRTKNARPESCYSTLSLLLAQRQADILSVFCPKGGAGDKSHSLRVEQEIGSNDMEVEREGKVLSGEGVKGEVGGDLGSNEEISGVGKVWAKDLESLVLQLWTDLLARPDLLEPLTDAPRLFEQFGYAAVNHAASALAERTKCSVNETKFPADLQQWWDFGFNLIFKVSTQRLGQSADSSSCKFQLSLAALATKDLSDKTKMKTVTIPLLTAVIASYVQLRPDLPLGQLLTCRRLRGLYLPGNENCLAEWMKVPELVGVLQEKVQAWMNLATKDKNGVMIVLDRRTLLPGSELDDEEKDEVVAVYDLLFMYLLKKDEMKTWREVPWLVDALELLVTSHVGPQIVDRWWNLQVKPTERRNGKQKPGARQLAAAHALLASSESAIYLRCVSRALFWFDQPRLTAFLRSTSPPWGPYTLTHATEPLTQRPGRRPRRPSRQNFVNYLRDDQSKFKPPMYVLEASWGLHKLTPGQLLLIKERHLARLQDPEISAAVRLASARRLTFLPGASQATLLHVLVHVGGALPAVTTRGDGGAGGGLGSSCYLTEESDFDVMDVEEEDKRMESSGDESGSDEEDWQQVVKIPYEDKGTKDKTGSNSANQQAPPGSEKEPPKAVPSDMTSLAPKLDPAVLTVVLNGIRYLDEPITGLNFVASPPFLRSHGTVTMALLRSTARCLQSVDDEFEIMNKLMDGPRRKAIKLTVLKDMVRQLAAAGSPRAVALILREKSRPRAHRDIHVAIMQSAIRILSSGRAAVSSRQLLQILEVPSTDLENLKPDALLPYFSVCPSPPVNPTSSSNPSKTQKTTKTATRKLSEAELGIPTFRFHSSLDALIAQLKELPLLTLPPPLCDVFLRHSLLPICRQLSLREGSGGSNRKQEDKNWALAVLALSTLAKWQKVADYLTEEVGFSLAHILRTQLVEMTRAIGTVTPGSSRNAVLEILQPVCLKTLLQFCGMKYLRWHELLNESELAPKRKPLRGADVQEVRILLEELVEVLGDPPLDRQLAPSRRLRAEAKRCVAAVLKELPVVSFWRKPESDDLTLEESARLVDRLLQRERDLLKCLWDLGAIFWPALADRRAKFLARFRRMGAFSPLMPAVQSALECQLAESQSFDPTLDLSYYNLLELGLSTLKLPPTDRLPATARQLAALADTDVAPGGTARDTLSRQLARLRLLERYSKLPLKSEDESQWIEIRVSEELEKACFLARVYRGAGQAENSEKVEAQVVRFFTPYFGLYGGGAVCRVAQGWLQEYLGGGLSPSVDKVLAGKLVRRLIEGRTKGVPLDFIGPASRLPFLCRQLVEASPTYLQALEHDEKALVEKNAVAHVRKFFDWLRDREEEEAKGREANVGEGGEGAREEWERKRILFHETARQWLQCLVVRLGGDGVPEGSVPQDVSSSITEGGEVPVLRNETKMAVGLVREAGLSCLELAPSLLLSRITQTIALSFVLVLLDDQSLSRLRETELQKRVLQLFKSAIKDETRARTSQISDDDQLKKAKLDSLKSLVQHLLHPTQLPPTNPVVPTISPHGTTVARQVALNLVQEVGPTLTPVSKDGSIPELENLLAKLADGSTPFSGAAWDEYTFSANPRGFLFSTE